MAKNSVFSAVPDTFGLPDKAKGADGTETVDFVLLFLVILAPMFFLGFLDEIFRGFCTTLGDEGAAD